MHLYDEANALPKTLPTGHCAPKEVGSISTNPSESFFSFPPDRRMLHRSRAPEGDHVRQTERQRQRGIPHRHVQEVRRHRTGGDFVQPEEQKTSRNS